MLTRLVGNRRLWPTGRRGAWRRWRPAAALLALPLLGGAPATGEVTGEVVLLETARTPGRLEETVVWLEGDGLRATAPTRATILTREKTFRPRVTLVAPGAVVAFPNDDSFDHNVFSLAETAPFDLGLYSRGEGRTAAFPRAGLVKVYCNVHARMSAFVLVLDGPAAFADAEGRFRLPEVPAGRYTLHAWHERAGEVRQAVDVPATGSASVRLVLDARAYRVVPHLDKEGKPYGARTRRY